MTTAPREDAAPDEEPPAPAGVSARHMLILAYLGALGTLLAGIGTLLAAVLR